MAESTRDREPGRGSLPNRRDEWWYTPRGLWTTWAMSVVGAFAAFALATRRPAVAAVFALVVPSLLLAANWGRSRRLKAPGRDGR